MKNCNKCGALKAFPEFYKRGDKKGLMSFCKGCWKAARVEYRKKHPERAKAVDLKVHYGISLEDYNEKFALQKGSCAICNRHQSSFKRALSVDHNHLTKELRGLLCGQCNTALGKFQESIEVLQNAIAYLNRYNSRVGDKNTTMIRQVLVKGRRVLI